MKSQCRKEITQSVNLSSFLMGLGVVLLAIMIVFCVVGYNPLPPSDPKEFVSDFVWWVNIEYLRAEEKMAEWGWVEKRVSRRGE